MEIKQTNFNTALLLEDDDFIVASQYNIDYIVSHAMTHNNAEFFGKAAVLCERFHSYFHFEQSFAHCLYAKELYNKADIAGAIAEYKAAIFQDHLNIEAHIALLQCYKEIDLMDEHERATKYAHKMNLNLTQITPYKRPFVSFTEYLSFATQHLHTTAVTRGFWIDLVNGNLDKALDGIKKNHSLYHANAGILYRNCHMAYTARGDTALAQHALMRTQNFV